MTNLYTKKGLLLARGFERIVKIPNHINLSNYFEVNHKDIVYGHLEPLHENKILEKDLKFVNLKSKDSTDTKVHFFLRKSGFQAEKNLKLCHYYIMCDKVVARD